MCEEATCCSRGQDGRCGEVGSGGCKPADGHFERKQLPLDCVLPQDWTLPGLFDASLPGCLLRSRQPVPLLPAFSLQVPHASTRESQAPEQNVQALPIFSSSLKTRHLLYQSNCLRSDWRARERSHCLRGAPHTKPGQQIQVNNTCVEAVAASARLLAMRASSSADFCFAIGDCRSERAETDTAPAEFVSSSSSWLLAAIQEAFSGLG